MRLTKEIQDSCLLYQIHFQGHIHKLKYSEESSVAKSLLYHQFFSGQPCVGGFIKPIVNPRCTHCFLGLSTQCIKQKIDIALKLG